MKIETEDFGFLKNGTVIKKFTLTNKNNIRVVLTNYGATLMNLECPDRNGCNDDILLGFDDLKGYLDNRFFGSTMGRCTNRIANGSFQLDGKTYKLACNNGINHIHGGERGFDTKVWSWKELVNGIEFYMTSTDGDEGYPGILTVKSSYILNDDNELTMQFAATVDEVSTIVNMTNHAVINLAGQKKDEDIRQHKLEINARKYTPVDKNLIPTGEISNVEETLDFYGDSSKLIGKDIDNVDGGYDHNFCLEPSEDGFCARIYHEDTGRQLEIFTNQPGVQCYSGNFIDAIGKNNRHYKPRSGICLEPQIYPDAINHDNFPSPILKPGETYEKYIKWKLSTN